MNRKILCVYTVDSILCKKDKPIRYISDIPLGMSYIMSAVKYAGYDLDLFVFSQKNDMRRDINKLFSENDFDVVLFSSVSSQYFFVREIARYIKKIKPKIKNVIGGVHSTLNVNDVLKENCFDVVCVCDGEYAIAEYIKRIRNNESMNSIDNLYIRVDENNILKPNRIYFIENLDKLQQPLRDIWNKWISFPNSVNSAHNLLITRGCYNNCSYCSNHALSKFSPTKYVRYRNVDKIIEELNFINPKKVQLNTESLTLNLDFLNELLDALIKNNEDRLEKIEYFVDININESTLNEKFFKKLREANIKIVSVGLESGSYDIRKNILHRPQYTNDNFYKFCKLAKKFNIAVYVYVLIGIPYEKQEDYLKTVGILRKAQPNFIRHYIYMPYPGTDLYKKLIEDKLIKNSEFLSFSQERIKALLSYPGMPKWKIQYNYFSFLFRVYVGNKSLIDVLKLTIGVFIYTYNKYIPVFLYSFLEKNLETSIRETNKSF